MKYRGLIFDLDGTLIDSFRDIVDSWNEALLLCGFPSVHPDKFVEPIRRGKEAILNMAIPKNAPQSASNEVLATYKDCYRRNWNRHSTAFPGVNELLSEIHNRGIKCAVLSNKAQDMTDLCCATFLFTQGLSAIRGASDKYSPKPSPNQAVEIAKEFGLPSSAIAVVGDTEIDMQTAYNAGYGRLLATWDATHQISPNVHYAVATLKNPKNVLDYVCNPT